MADRVLTGLRAPASVQNVQARVPAPDRSASQLSATLLDVAEKRRKAREAVEVSKAQADAAIGISTLASDLEQDPDYGTALERYDEQSSALVNQALSGISNEQTRALMEQRLRQASHSARIRLDQQVFRREADAAIAGLDEQLTQFSQGAAGNAAERQAFVQMGDEAIVRMAQSGFITQQDAVARSEQFRRDIDEVAARQLIQSNPYEARQALGDDSRFEHLDPVLRIRLRDSADADIRAAEREARARAREAGSEARYLMGQADKIIAQGLEPEADLVDRIAATTAASGDPALRERLDTLAGVLTQAREMRGMTPAEQEAHIAALERPGMASDADRAARLKSARSIFAETRRAVASDPLAHARRNAVVPIEPVDFSDPESVEARMSAAVRVSERYGTEFKFFTQAEAGAVGRQLDQLEPDSQAEAIGALTQTLGPHAPAGLAQLADAGEGTLAHAGGLMAQSPAYHRVASEILAGRKAMADGADVSIRPVDREAIMADVIGNALGPQYGAVRARIQEAADAHYTAQAVIQGVSAFDARLYEKSLRAVSGEIDGTGGFDQINGQMVALPPGRSADDLEDVIASLEDADLKTLTGDVGAFHGDGTPATASDLREGYLVTVSPGRYRVSMTRPENGAEYLVTRDGAAAVIFDLTGQAARPGASALREVDREDFGGAL